MSLLKELVKKLNETAAMGAVSAASIAVSTDTIPRKKDKKVKNKKTSFIGFKKNIKENYDLFNKEEVMSKLRSADKFNQTGEMVYFGLEDDKGQITKVGVRKSQANQFEDFLSKEMGRYNDSNKTPVDSALPKKEIAEILFNAREKFDIVDVKWPEFEEDEEIPSDISDAGDESKQDDTPKDMPQDMEIEPEMEPSFDPLKDIIDYLKKDAEAKAEESRARAAEAKARELELSISQEDKKLQREEELLDMEAYYKEKREKDAEDKKLSQLAKFRQEKAKEMELGMVSDENEELKPSKALSISPETLIDFLRKIKNNKDSK